MRAFLRTPRSPGLAGMIVLATACGGPSSSGSESAGNGDPKAGDSGIPWGASDLMPITSGLKGIEIAGRCALDLINGKRRADVSSVKGNEPLTLRGWVSNSFNVPPKQAMFALQSPEEAFAIKLEAKEDRADVAKALGVQALSRSGYELTIPPQLPVGTYRVGILFGGPGDPQACSLDHDLVID